MSELQLTKRQIVLYPLVSHNTGYVGESFSARLLGNAAGPPSIFLDRIFALIPKIAVPRRCSKLGKLHKRKHAHKGIRGCD